MEKTHRRKLSERFKSDLHNKKIICLNIPDHYDYMEDNLVNLLRQKVTPYLPPSL
jgi:predicted protein tyrosine phosphatase